MSQERALKRRGLEIPVWEGFWKWAVTVNAAGAWASAVIYSIVETAKANGLNVFQYLYLVLLYMPDYQNEPAGIGQLLPWSDFIQKHCSGLIDIENITAEAHVPFNVIHFTINFGQLGVQPV